MGIKIEKWLKSYLKKEDLSSLEKAVAQAESQTSGEIVPMVVRHSSTLGHVPLTLFLFGITLLFLTPLFDVSLSLFPLSITCHGFLVGITLSRGALSCHQALYSKMPG